MDAVIVTRDEQLIADLRRFVANLESWEFDTQLVMLGAMEDDARQMYAFMRDADPVLVGFMRRDRVGASPDSLIGDDGLLEIKTKLPHLQIECLERDALPPEHIAQVQGQLWVSGRAFCDFVSYWPRMQLFHKRVERDETYIAKLAQEVETFIGELDALVKKYSTEELRIAA